MNFTRRIDVKIYGIDLNHLILRLYSMAIERIIGRSKIAILSIIVQVDVSEQVSSVEVLLNARNGCMKKDVVI